MHSSLHSSSLFDAQIFTLGSSRLVSPISIPRCLQSALITYPWRLVHLCDLHWRKLRAPSARDFPETFQEAHCIPLCTKECGGLSVCLHCFHVCAPTCDIVLRVIWLKINRLKMRQGQSLSHFSTNIDDISAYVQKIPVHLWTDSSYDWLFILSICEQSSRTPAWCKFMTTMPDAFSFTSEWWYLIWSRRIPHLEGLFVNTPCACSLFDAVPAIDTDLVDWCDPIELLTVSLF